MTLQVKLAKYAGRLVLFSWAKPSALEHVLQPAGVIDWRVQPEYHLDRVADKVCGKV